MIFTSINSWLIVSIILMVLIVVLAVLVVLFKNRFIANIENEAIKKHEEQTGETKERIRQMQDEILLKAKEEAISIKDRALQEGRSEIDSIRRECDNEIKERKKIVVDLENKLNVREDSLERRSINLDRREELLNTKETKIDDLKQEVEEIKEESLAVLNQHKVKLVEIANLTEDEAKKIILDEVHERISSEIAQYIRDEEEKARTEVQNKAKNMLALAIQKYSGEVASENTISTVSLPVDEMKGRIIGREGRNIRTIESLTGVDLIIDDTPEAVVLSAFDPVRREVAKKALEILVSDGRIHPARIEEVVERCRSEVELNIREKGEDAVFQTGIGKIHPDLVKLIGRLHYRTSYGQNVLKHSIETAMIAGKLASELGENEILARRAGLLHDLGKAVDHEVEGSHVEIGVELANKYHEPKEVVDAIASHHEDCAPNSIIAVLVAAADALSSARPGARSDSLENYTKRLESLEQISNSIPGVSSSYAIQAGREIRVIVNPDNIDDLSTITVARKIKEEIESKLSYPGSIKVTVIRETRAVEVAK